MKVLSVFLVFLTMVIISCVNRDSNSVNREYPVHIQFKYFQIGKRFNESDPKSPQELNIYPSKELNSRLLGMFMILRLLMTASLIDFEKIFQIWQWTQILNRV
jgi:hypothetical protein